MDELGLGQLGEVVALEQRELLERRRPCPPRACLADREPAVVERDRRLQRRLPRGQVVAREQAAFGLAEARDLLGDEALVVRLPRALDLVPLGSRPCSRRRCVDTSPRARGCGRARLPPESEGRAPPSRATTRAAPGSPRSSPGCDRRAGSRAPRTRSRTRGRRRSATSRSRAGAGASRRRHRERTPRARRCQGRARARAPGSGRSSQPRVRHPGRRGRAAPPVPRTRRSRAPRRRARSGAARRPGGRTPSHRPRRTHCRRAPAPTSRPPRRASASRRPSRTCRGARVSW